MMLSIVLIRHGKTQANMEGRYLSRTDEPLCEEGKAQLQSMVEQGMYPSVNRLFCGPLRRCRETAALLYPQLSPKIMMGLREYDFGNYEGKRFSELENDRAYSAWLVSNGTLPFPGAELQQDFSEGVRLTFLQVTKLCHAEDRIGIVCHAGTIMAIMDAYCNLNRDFYDWQVENGCCIQFTFDTDSEQITEYRFIYGNESKKE